LWRSTPSPVLDPGLLKLGEWIAQYYIAPIGEVFRSMLPLTAEVKKQIVYRIASPATKLLPPPPYRIIAPFAPLPKPSRELGILHALAHATFAGEVSRARRSREALYHSCSLVPQTER